MAHGYSHYGETIEFIVHTRGLAIGGSGKGFAYAADADPDATIIEGDLDAAAASLSMKDVLLERRIRRQLVAGIGYEVTSLWAGSERCRVLAVLRSGTSDCQIAERVNVRKDTLVSNCHDRARIAEPLEKILRAGLPFERGEQ